MNLPKGLWERATYVKAVDSDDLLLCAITRGDGYGQLERNELTLV